MNSLSEMEPPEPKFGYLERYTTFPLICTPRDAFNVLKTTLEAWEDVYLNKSVPDKFKLECEFAHLSRTMLMNLRVFTKSPNEYVLEIQRRRGDNVFFWQVLQKLLKQLEQLKVISPSPDKKSTERPYLNPFEIGEVFFDTVDMLIRTQSNDHPCIEMAHVLVDFTFWPCLLDPAISDPSYISTIQKMYRHFRCLAAKTDNEELSTLGFIGLCNLATSGIPVVVESMAKDPIIHVAEEETPSATERRKRWIRKYQRLCSVEFEKKN